MQAKAHRNLPRMLSRLAGLMLSLASVQALAIIEGDYLYIVENGHAVITGFGGFVRIYEGSLVITNRLGGYPVAAIGDNAFSQCHGLTDVTIPEGVISIGFGAFQMCSSLTNVTFPASMNSIGGGAFSLCTNLTSIAIPPGLTSISTGTFSGCSRLTSVDIPISVTNIWWFAFAGTGITNITINSSVSFMAGDAFSGCAGLTEFNVDAGNLSYTTETGVLFSKDKSTLVAYPPGGPCSYDIQPNVVAIGASAFSGCGGLTNVTFPSSVTMIGDSAFSSCSGLTRIEIPPSVPVIGDSTYCGCSGLADVTIPLGVTSIGRQAFLYCYGLTNVTIASSVTWIDYHAFGDCTSLTSVRFEGDRPSVGQYGFPFPYIDHWPDPPDPAFYYLPGKNGWTSPWWGHPTVCAVPGIPAVSYGFCDGVTHPYVSALVATLGSHFTGTVAEVDQQIADQFETADLMGLYCTDLTTGNILNLAPSIAIAGLAVAPATSVSLSAVCRNGITTDTVAMDRLLRDPATRELRVQARDSLSSDANVTNLTPVFVRSGATATATFTAPPSPMQFYKVSVRRK